ncbi:MAG: biliverdin-producing heme oxygenase [Pseudomonadota bacterium]
MDNRAFLKSATRDVHRRTEARWVGSEGFSDRRAYEDWLHAMLAVHSSVSLPAARKLARRDFIAEEHLRLDALRRDLDQPTLLPTPPCRHSDAWAWGAQYVVNGSAMGACILLKSGQVDVRWPHAYLKVMSGFAKGGALKGFFEELDQLALNRDEALAGAEAAFPRAVVRAA